MELVEGLRKFIDKDDSRFYIIDSANTFLWFCFDDLINRRGLMYLRTVEIFCAVAARRSFSKAAQEQGVSQPAVSQAVHQLESRLGVQLIDRSQRPLELTPAGELYYEGCRKLLSEFGELEDRVRRLGNRVAGRVQIAAIYSVGLLQMHVYVRQYNQMYPDVELSVAYFHPDEVYERVLSEDAQLGLVSFPQGSGEIAVVPWRSEPMVLVVWPEHPLAGRKQVSVKELDGAPFVAFSYKLKIRKRIGSWLRRSRVSVKIVHEFDSIEYIKRAVEIGAGITILPLPTLKREIESGTLVAVPFEDVDWHRPLGIIHRRRKQLTTPCKKFIELLLEEQSRAETKMPESVEV